jgi:murein L,D-transpeptidase YcbB/YkuD
MTWLATALLALTLGIAATPAQAVDRETDSGFQTASVDRAAEVSEGDPSALDELVQSTLMQKLSQTGDVDPIRTKAANFYKRRGGKPIWLRHGKLTRQARRALDHLARAAEDGLDPADYHVPAADDLDGSIASIEGTADGELAITESVLRYIRHATSGRLDPATLRQGVRASPHEPDPVMALASIAIATDPASVLASLNPPHSQYLALKQRLAELRATGQAGAKDPQKLLPAGAVLRQGMADARVHLLRLRLGVPTADGDVFDDVLAQAVRQFQKQRGLKVTGAVGEATLVALNKRPISPEHRLIVNMERWRWIPRDLGSSHVFVNIPGYELEVIQDGSSVHKARVIVGRPSTPTPIFSDEMDFVVLNPSWNVPESIIEKEYLPKLSEDPDFLARQGFEVTKQGDSISVRQPPGEANALGRIKFMFPNDFHVYLHDTPSRELFGQPKRALSHGCVRVDNPLEFADIVLGKMGGWTELQLLASEAGEEHLIKMKRRLPVHLAYFTTAITADGEMKSFEDIYGLDAQLLLALGLR